MTLPSIILVCTTLGLGATSVYFYTELDAERARANAEAALRRDQENRLQAMEARLNSPFGAPLSDATGPPPPPPTSLGADKPIPQNVATEEAKTEAQNQRRTPNFRAHLREMLATPEGRADMLNRHKMGLRMQYRDLARELKLSPEQADRVMTLLAEQQLRQMEQLQETAGDRDRARQVMTQLQSQNEAEMLNLLGDKYLQYENYQKSIGERMQVQQIDAQLEAVNLSLNDSQQKQLVAAMVEERDAIPRPAWTPQTNPEDFMTKQLAWQKEYNQRVRDRAASVLNAAQLKEFEQVQQSQMPMIGMPGMTAPAMRFNNGAMRATRPPRQQ